MDLKKLNEREEELKHEIVILKKKTLTSEVLRIIALRRARVSEIQRMKKILK